MTEERVGASVLVVEDEPDLAALYADWLTPTYRVETVGTGEDALEEMAETPPDVVLLDRCLPDVSGGTVLSVLRDRGHRQPVAMVTAVSPGFDVLDMGFDEYVTKPVDAERLHGVVDHLLDARSWFDLRRELSARKIKRNVLRLEHRWSKLEDDEEYVRPEREIERLEARLERRKARTAIRPAEP